MLVQVLDIERDEKSDLPCEIEIDEYFDNTVGNDANLPDVVMNVVEEYDDRMLNKNTDGDKTRFPNVDRLYEIMIMWGKPIKHCYWIMETFENTDSYYNNKNNKLKVDKSDLCFKYVRCLYNDGG